MDDGFGIRVRIKNVSKLFQSLSQFNRVFRRVTGQSPMAWRAKLPKV